MSELETVAESVLKPEASLGIGQDRVKSTFMTSTFIFWLASNIMSTVELPLLSVIAKAHEMALGYDAAQASLHAAGIVFWIATTCGAMRIPGTYMGTWLHTRIEQRTLAGLSAVLRSANLVVVATHVFIRPWMGLFWGTALYSLDWFLGGFEDVARNTIPVTQIEGGSKEFKSWSTLSQFLSELPGIFGPFLVLALALKGGILTQAGFVLAPLLFAASAVFYFRIPEDKHRRIPSDPLEGGTPNGKFSRTEKWQLIFKTPSFGLPVAAFALLAVWQLKGAMSLNMASLLLRKSGSDLLIYSAALSIAFGLGSGVGAWMAHRHDDSKSWSRSNSVWMVLSALGVAIFVASWISAAWAPAIAFGVVALGWGVFAMTNANCRLLVNHLLQDTVSKAAKKNPELRYVLGYNQSLGHVVITALRIIAGGIFFVLAPTWQVAFALFGGVMLVFAAGQLAISWWMSKSASISV